MNFIFLIFPNFCGYEMLCHTTLTIILPKMHPWIYLGATTSLWIIYRLQTNHLWRLCTRLPLWLQYLFSVSVSIYQMFYKINKVIPQFSLYCITPVNIFHPFNYRLVCIRAVESSQELIFRHFSSVAEIACSKVD